MLKHLYLLLISTFLIGFLSGAFIYFITRGPTVIEPPEEISEGDFEIIVDMYGGCNQLGTCASYRIEDDGEYTYIERNRGEIETRHEGELRDGALNELSRLLSRTNFERVEQSRFTETCPIAYDGIAYRYEIRYGGRHRIDSCVQDVEGVSLFESLNGYFAILEPSDQ